MNTTTQLTWRDGVEAIDTLVSAELDKQEYPQEAVAQINSEYSLAKLLYRVIEAGWAGKRFGAMRKELHSQVVEGMEKNADTPITEGGN